ncbi:UDP-N-acetylglucosamine 2-epimerase (hydrolyzing) [Candidatus Woesearchaeota archaeon]|nr:UDP-N-acetylglucosamine 2-epimerase (hydrolyzing) [Candidatus Woesearchaeota archaeon]MBT7106105.1 UDP-N-acetylglucosamine 2-epimerase (hydrolyzing) [Candidatus Woesearchaeota archaeon]
MRKIVVVTGSRAEYGLLKPVMLRIKEHHDAELVVIATGMHMMRSKGNTIDEIKKDFSIGAEVDMGMADDQAQTLIRSLGIGIEKLVEVLARIKPDIVLVLGDRNEALAAAITASQLMIPVAHIHGGDLTNSGTIDESIRYAITDFSHIHFAATEKSAERLKKVGEEQWRIHVTGSPAIDAINSINYMSREEIMDKFNLDANKKFTVLIHNPVTIDPEGSFEDLKVELDTLSKMDIQAVIIYPNADRGSERMINLIDSYEDVSTFKIHKNIPHNDFLNLLKYAAFLIGNSTSGIIEAPSLNIPVINVGERQTGREYFGYVKFIKSDSACIKKEINQILDGSFSYPETNNPYGDGSTSEKIVQILMNENLDGDILKKRKCLL